MVATFDPLAGRWHWNCSDPAYDGCYAAVGGVTRRRRVR